ncbi:MAG: methyl-accepting chemotaxis protein [Chloroflexi bacterium]|nr:methyl-accepting chemotaxis protein [Chloroflexota bacterium]
MQKSVFKLATLFMNRLSYSRKMLLVAVVFLIPIIVLTYQLAVQFKAEIDFTRQEQKGDEYLSPVLDLLQHVQQHRGATNTFLAGDATFKEIMTAKQTAISADIAAIDAMELLYGAEFQSGKRWLAIKEEWSGLQAQVESLTAAESFASHTALIAKILEFRIYIADASNLTLDSDIDTFYLMSAVVDRYPKTSEYMGQLRALGSGELVDGEVSDKGRAQLEILLKLINSNSIAAAEGLARAIEYNPDLRTELEASIQATQAEQTTFLNLVQDQVLGATTITVTSKEYFAAATKAIDATLGLVAKMDSAGDALFQARLTRLNGQNLLAYLLAGIPALLALWLFVGFYISVTEALVSMKEAARRIAHGDVSQSVDYRSNDEMGQLAENFRNTIDYLQNIARVSEKMSRNDLTEDVEPKSEKDILGNAFVRMLTNLREVIGIVAENAKTVAEAAVQLALASGQSGEATSQIATTIQQVAIGTAQQTEGVTRTASSVEQMGRAIDGVAKGAQEQAKAIGQASQITSRINAAIEQVTYNAEAVTRDSAQAATYSRDGSKTVKETILGMEAIRTKVGLSATKVEEMGTRSEEIGAIVETIEDIASQTNLLALNAAIEAARAGEQGKGFAVVADEVRKLAERSSLATKEIAALIKGIQKTVGEAVIAMQASAVEVEDGVTRANSAGVVLENILGAAEAVYKQAEEAGSAAAKVNTAAAELVEAVDSVSAVIEENTAATEEMAANSIELTQAIENIASVSEENSAAVEQVSAATEEMSAQVEEVTASAASLMEMAKKLQEVASRFMLK